MPDFRLVADFEPTGDQPAAIERLVDGLEAGLRHQTLLGVTGSGKTWTIANAIARYQKPTLVLAHNKTLAAQLYAEFREFFPDNAVEYFVSYFDYYQPEAYLPRSDTYIEKDSSRNDEIDKLRHAATHALFERRDVIIVASVSCIYGLGAPVDYGATVIRAPQVMHGKTSEISHTGQGVFSGLPNPFTATRYHSLIVERASVPDVLEITAETSDGIVMGLRHREYPIEGVQFHPESILTESGHDLLRNFLAQTAASVATN